MQVPLPARTLQARWSVHSDPTLLAGHPAPDKPLPGAAASQGPALSAALSEPSALLPRAPTPTPPSAPLRRQGRVAEREEALEEGGSGSGPTCISVPAVSSGGGGGGSRSLSPPTFATSA